MGYPHHIPNTKHIGTIAVCQKGGNETETEDEEKLTADDVMMIQLKRSNLLIDVM